MSTEATARIADSTEIKTDTGFQQSQVVAHPAARSSGAEGAPEPPAGAARNCEPLRLRRLELSIGTSSSPAWRRLFELFFFGTLLPPCAPPTGRWRSPACARNLLAQPERKVPSFFCVHGPFLTFSPLLRRISSSCPSSSYRTCFRISSPLPLRVSYTRRLTPPMVLVTSCFFGKEGHVEGKIPDAPGLVDRTAVLALAPVSERARWKRPAPAVRSGPRWCPFNPSCLPAIPHPFLEAPGGSGDLRFNCKPQARLRPDRQAQSLNGLGRRNGKAPGSPEPGSRPRALPPGVDNTIRRRSSCPSMFPPVS